MNRTEAEAIASAVAILRPAWRADSMLTLLGKLQHRPARQVALALTSLAYDADVQSPGLVLSDGPWWGVGTIAEPTYIPPTQTERTCSRHGDRSPCRGCAADRKAAVAVAALEVVPERMEGESLVAWARRVADLSNPREGETVKPAPEATSADLGHEQPAPVPDTTPDANEAQEAAQ